MTKYAAEIGVNRQVLQSWMKKKGEKGAKVPDHADSVRKLVAYFGPEVYSALGINQDDEEIKYLIDLLTPDEQQTTKEFINRLIGSRGNVGRTTEPAKR